MIHAGHDSLPRRERGRLPSCSAMARRRAAGATEDCSPCGDYNVVSGDTPTLAPSAAGSLRDPGHTLDAGVNAALTFNATGQDRGRTTPPSRRQSSRTSRLIRGSRRAPGHLWHHVRHHAAQVAQARRADLGDHVVDDLLELLPQRLGHEFLEHRQPGAPARPPARRGRAARKRFHPLVPASAHAAAPGAPRRRGSGRCSSFSAERSAARIRRSASRCPASPARMASCSSSSIRTTRLKLQ